MEDSSDRPGVLHSDYVVHNGEDCLQAAVFEQELVAIIVAHDVLTLLENYDGHDQVDDGQNCQGNAHAIQLFGLVPIALSKKLALNSKLCYL